MDIKKEDIEKLKKHLEFIDKVYYEKIEYLDDADTKEDAFKEGINAAVQALNIHGVIERFYAYLIINKCMDIEKDEIERDIEKFLNAL